MKDYLERTFHTQISIEKYKSSSLPIFLKKTYELSETEMAGITFLVARPLAEMNLSRIKKHWRLLVEQTGMPCVFLMEQINSYAKEQMMELGIPFVIVGKQIFLPFLGVVLTSREDRQFLPPSNISFMTQRMLLKAFYQKWSKQTLTEIAAAMQVSRTSITRCFDELEGLKLPVIVNEGKYRFFQWEKSRKELWQLVFPVLRSPVAASYLLEDFPDTDMLRQLGGISAVSVYSRLADNIYPTFAISKADLKRSNIKMLRALPRGEIPTVRIDVMQYQFPFGDEKAIDPITAILTVSDIDKNDARVEQAIEEILEEYVW